METKTTPNGFQNILDVFKESKDKNEGMIDVQTIAERSGEDPEVVKKFCSLGVSKCKLTWQIGADKYMLQD